MCAISQPLYVPVAQGVPLHWHSTWSRAIIRPTLLIFSVLALCVVCGFAAFVAAMAPWERIQPADTSEQSAVPTVAPGDRPSVIYVAELSGE